MSHITMWFYPVLTITCLCTVFSIAGCQSSTENENRNSESKVIAPWDPAKDAAKEAKTKVESSDRELRRQLQMLDE